MSGQFDILYVNQMKLVPQSIDEVLGESKTKDFDEQVKINWESLFAEYLRDVDGKSQYHLLAFYLSCKGFAQIKEEEKRKTAGNLLLERFIVC